MAKALILLALSIPAVYAHGYVTGIEAEGKYYTGFNPAFQYDNPPPVIPGWSTVGDLDNGFVPTSSYGAPDIICHKGATPGQAYVTVKAGETVSLLWNTWPNSHVGPVMDYLASCGSSCTTVDKTTLSFVKIDQGAWKSGYNPGSWVTDDLIANNFTWNSKIPSTLKPGLYVLRHEIIALHAAASVGGAQAYPQCVNLNVTSGGSTAISGGALATTFYKDTDPGIVFDVYSPITSYPIPGPALWSSAGTKMRRYMKSAWESM